MPPISGKRNGDGIQAVVLALSMLEFIAHSSRAVGVTELSKVFGTTKSRIHRHLQTLVGAGYLVHEAETERYRVSARLVAMGQVVSEGHELMTIARPTIRELRDKMGHSVALSVPENNCMRIIGTMPGTSNVEMGVKPGSVLLMHATAQGKVALAFGDENYSRALKDHPLEQLTPETVTDPAKLAGDVREVRAKGWATAYNQALLGLNAVAAPIFDALGQFVGAIAVVDSIQFIPAAPRVELITAVQSAAHRISADLGYRPAAV